MPFRYALESWGFLVNAMITATGISTDRKVNSSVKHAVIAAKNCIAAAGIDVQEIDYLFNVGIYRDSNIVEPSIAALVQKGIGLNPDFTRYPVDTTAFSTDLMNGPAGAINAFRVTDALFKAGRKGYVLVVASDIHPSGKAVDDFPVTPCGGAVLLAPSSDERGFQAFAFDADDDDYMGQSSYVDFGKQGVRGRTSITIDTDPDYYDRVLDFAAKTATAFITKHRIDTTRTILIPHAFTSGFAEKLGARVGIACDAIINLWEDYGNPHTSTFGLGYHQLTTKGLPDTCKQVLFVGAGAGLHAGCALYAP